MSAYSVSSTPGGLTMTELKRQLKTPLVASRVPLPTRALHGKRDGEPIWLPKGMAPALQLNTGIDSLDQAGRQVSSLSQFGTSAVKDVLGSTLKGSLYGSISGLLVGLATQWRHTLQILALKPPLQALAVMGITSAVGSFLGAGLGLMQSTRQKLKEGRQLLQR